MPVFNVPIANRPEHERVDIVARNVETVEPWMAREGAEEKPVGTVIRTVSGQEIRTFTEQEKVRSLLTSTLREMRGA